MNKLTLATRTVFPFLFALAVGACSTAYQEATELPMFWPGAGYHEEAAPGGLIKVAFKGNRDILMYKVADYTLYRCAEIAQREKSPYFALYQTISDAIQNNRTSTVRPTTLSGLPVADVYVRLHQAGEPGLLSTAEVLARLRPSVRGDK